MAYYDVDRPVAGLMNPVLEVIEKRRSTRVFSDQPVTQEERTAILHAASRAPSAGAMMFYSIIVIDDAAVREKLCVACDNQPFMLKAPFWLLFVADNRKWSDLYEHAGCLDDASLATVAEYARRKPGMGDLLLACQDAVAAAQTAVLAAESLDIGSCYIGDVTENGEVVRELLCLPEETLPLSLLVFGHKKADVSRETSPDGGVFNYRQNDNPAGSGQESTYQPSYRQTPHPVVNLVMQDHYISSVDAGLMDEQVAELDAKFTPHAVEAGASAGERVRKLFHRKHTSEFMAEMNRSSALWYDNWCK